MIFWFVFFVLAGIALFYPWWWLAAAPLGLWCAGRLYFHFGRPWRRVHYPFLRTYSSATGIEIALAEREKRTIDIVQPLAYCIKRVHPEWTEREVHEFIRVQIEKCESFLDGQLIEEEFRRRKPNLGVEKILGLLGHLKPQFENPDNGWKVRMVIAGLVEEKYGRSGRGEYLIALITNLAD